MIVVFWGTHVFTRLVGFSGDRSICSDCELGYKKRVIKESHWVHFEYIPLFPIKSKYHIVCPVCGKRRTVEIIDMVYDFVPLKYDPQPDIEIYAKHILAKKPDGWFETDYSYELWARDLRTGNVICVGTNCTKKNVKNFKKNLGYKKIEIIEV